MNPRRPPSGRTGSCSARPTEAYSVAAQDILSILDSFSTTSVTITENQQALDDAAAVCNRLRQTRDQHDRPQ